MMLRVGMRSVEDEKINWEHQTREETKQLITCHGRTTKNVLVVVQADCGQSLVGWDGMVETSSNESAPTHSRTLCICSGCRYGEG
jgi:hypothetical protein